ncbi:unnamed protein product [Effrenium voratum]|nr:unnamed protein product [Effrenium voratum]
MSDAYPWKGKLCEVFSPTESPSVESCANSVGIPATEKQPLEEAPLDASSATKRFLSPEALTAAVTMSKPEGRGAPLSSLELPVPPPPPLALPPLDPRIQGPRAVPESPMGGTSSS